MSPRLQFIGLVGCLVLVIAIGTRLWRGAPVEGSLRSVERDARRLEITAFAPNLSSEQTERWLAEGDRFADAAQRAEIGRSMRKALKEVVVSEADRKAWYEANRGLFGQRSYEASADAIDRIVRIEALQRRLDVAVTP